MATLRQIQANRANAAKSTGPRTPEGKKRSSQNASLQRFDAALLADDLKTKKSQRRYNAIAAELTSEFQPANAAETALIETMAFARWRAHSLRELETATLQQEIDRARQDNPSLGFHDALAVAFHNLAGGPRSLLRLQRLQARYECQQYDALDALLNLRKTDLRKTAIARKPQQTFPQQTFPQQPSLPQTSPEAASAEFSLKANSTTASAPL